MKFGACKPFIAKRTAKGTYTDGFQCGKLMETVVNPQYAEASLYADNQLAEYRKKFKYADVTMNTNTLPKEADSVMFGRTVRETGGSTYNTNDEDNYVGYGFISEEKIDGETKHVAVVLFKVKFSDGNNSYKTEGENIEFNTPSISGKAEAEDNGDWLDREPFATVEEAEAYIKEKLCMVEAVQTTANKENA